MSIQFRIAARTDLARIVEIYNQTVLKHTITADTAPVTVAQRAAWFTAHAPAKWPLWVITGAEGVCGWISLSQFKGRAAYDHTAEISIYIDSAARGQHIGTQTLQFVDEHAPEFGIRNVASLIIGANAASLALFSKNGYAQWGRLPGVMTFAEGDQDLVIMGKRLGN